MNTENDSKFPVKEQTFIFVKEPLTVVKKADKALEVCDLQKNGINGVALSKNSIVLKEKKQVEDNGHIQIPVWRNRKIDINTHLIPLRVAQFLWFASGGLSLPFVSLMLTNRGLTLTQFSSAFSMLFPFQLTVAYVSGIVADKLGNAKPVLLFLMSASISTVIGLMLAPNIRDESCLEISTNMTCLRTFNHTSHLENCKHICSSNNTEYFTSKNHNNNSYDFLEYSKEIPLLNSSEIIESSSYSNRKLISCKEMCSCFSQSLLNCSSTSNSGLLIIYFILILSHFSIFSTVYRFLDFAALNVAKQHNSNFGRERIFSSLGKLLVTFLCNFVLNIDKSKAAGYYDNVYWFAILLQVLAMLSTWKLRKFILPPGLKMTKNTLKLFSDIEIISIIIVVFVAGSGFTFNMFYHLWFLNRLNASKRTIGLHIMTEPFYSFPIFATSEWWLKKLDTKTIVIVGLLSYTVNGICYSFLYHPWLSLLIEVTKAFSFQLFWVAIVTHCQKIAPKGFAATVNAVVGTAHFGIGRSFSIPVGGYLISTYGIRSTYRILAGFCLVTAILYSMFLYLRHLECKWNKKKQSKIYEEVKIMAEDKAENGILFTEKLLITV